MRACNVSKAAINMDELIKVLTTSSKAYYYGHIVVKYTTMNELIKVCMHTHAALYYYGHMVVYYSTMDTS